MALESTTKKEMYLIKRRTRQFRSHCGHLVPFFPIFILNVYGNPRVNENLVLLT